MLLYEGIVELEYVPYEGVYVKDAKTGAYIFFDRDYDRKYRLKLEHVEEG